MALNKEVHLLLLGKITMVKKVFFSGVAAVVPVVMTIYVVYLIFSFVDTVIGTWINRFLEDYVSSQIPEFLGVIIGLIITVIIIFLIGGLVHISRMRLSRWIEKFFFSWPLVNKIYFPIKRIVNFLFSPPHKTFKSAVLVEYPRKGVYAVGFITSETSQFINDRIGKKLYNVFISSSPSPFTGFTILVEESEIVFLDIAIDEALQFIVSGGLLNPGKHL